MGQLGVVFDKIGLLNNLGGLAYARADRATALEFFHESLALAQELGDLETAEQVRHNLTVLAEAAAQIELAQEEA